MAGITEAFQWYFLFSLSILYLLQEVHSSPGKWHHFFPHLFRHLSIQLFISIWALGYFLYFLLFVSFFYLIFFNFTILYFICIFLIHCYHLLCCSGYFNFSHWRLFQVASYDLYICPNPYFSFQQFFSEYVCVYLYVCTFPSLLAPQEAHHVFSLIQSWSQPALHRVLVILTKEWYLETLIWP